MERKKLIAMDMDGTLTQHKSTLEPECRQVLEELGKRYRLLMVCAGGCRRVYDQLLALDIPILGFYGMQYAEVRDGSMKIIESKRISVDREKILSCGRKIRERFGFTEYAGEPMEFHDSGMITFPILGTDAALTDKLSFDPDRTKRRRCYDEVCRIFDGCNVFIGGTSSFDIAPRPYDKRYALEQYLENNHLCHSEVIFFGDDYGIGGNDRCVYESDIAFVGIDNYREFPDVAAELLLK